MSLADLPLEQLRAALAVVFVFGLLWGSFLNVVIHRLPLGESVVTPRSRCPECRSLIRWYQNVPVVSWLALRGRCAKCGTKISWRYPLVELLTATLFALGAARYPDLASLPFRLWFLAALVACTFIDFDHWILPDKITLPGIAIGFASSFLRPDLGWMESLAGIVVGGGILYAVAWGYKVLAHKDGLGGGDIKFLAMIGAFLGAKGALATLILSSLLGSVLGVLLITLKGKKGGTAIQFGPFLALGAVVAFFYGEILWAWYFHLG